MSSTTGPTLPAGTRSRRATVPLWLIVVAVLALQALVVVVGRELLGLRIDSEPAKRASRG